jgi:hypothetical protein
VPGAARTILLFYTISARPSTQPRMVGSTLGVYSFGLIFVSARTNKRHHHHGRSSARATTRQPSTTSCTVSGQRLAHVGKQEHISCVRRTLVKTRMVVTTGLILVSLKSTEFLEPSSPKKSMFPAVVLPIFANISLYFCCTVLSNALLE